MIQEITKRKERQTEKKRERRDSRDYVRVVALLCLNFSLSSCVLLRISSARFIISRMNIDIGAKGNATKLAAVKKQ